MNPITREESLLDGQDLTPITRKEQFIKRIYDKTQEIPEPITREEWFLKKAGEGTSPVTIEQLNATENGTYSEEGKAYSPVIVEVPAPTLITKSITANGTYTASADNADGYSSVTVAVEGFKKKSIANTPTDIASFNDGTANPMPSLEISIVPVQSGSGDPSPQNVRPISGWSGANVTRCGKNWWGKGNINGVTTYDVAGLYIPIGTWTLSVVATSEDTDSDKCLIYDLTPSNSGELGRVERGSRKYITFTTNHVITKMRFYASTGYDASQGDAFAFTDIQLEIGNIATEYTPYQGSTLSIPFHDSSDNPITVYGGTLNVTSGELTETLAKITIDGVNKKVKSWGVVNNGYGVYYVFDVSRDKIKMCDKFTETDANRSRMELYTYIGSGGTDNTCSFILPSTVTTVDEANVWFSENPTTILYELATPQTYQLTPTQVTTLLEQNNIFADCGQVLEGEYFVTL